MSDVARLPERNSSRAAAGRERLMLVAMKLFAERGFDSVTVRDISAEAGVSVGLINHHFASKEGLRQAVDDYFIRSTSVAIERAIRSTSNLDPNLIAEYQRRWIMSAEEQWPHFLAYLRRAVMEASPWGEALFKRYYESIRLMMDRFDAQGMFKPEADRLWLPFLYMFVLLGPLVMDPFIRATLGKSTYDPDMWGRFQKAANTMFWSGVRAPDPEKS
jgi:AcrR family transcriptional regulator